jgi:hypothetical protein
MTSVAEETVMTIEKMTDEAAGAEAGWFRRNVARSKICL